MSHTAATELEIPGIVSGEHRPKVVVSYGLGLDSTCLLLRWLTEPETRDFDLADMVVLTAMTGDEFRSTARDVETYILPLFRRFGVRYIQCARSDRTPTANGNGVVVLDDSTCPQKLYSDGAYRLSTLTDRVLTVRVVRPDARIAVNVLFNRSRHLSSRWVRWRGYGRSACGWDDPRAARQASGRTSSIHCCRAGGIAHSGR